MGISYTSFTYIMIFLCILFQVNPKRVYELYKEPYFEFNIKLPDSQISRKALVTEKPELIILINYGSDFYDITFHSYSKGSLSSQYMARKYEKQAGFQMLKYQWVLNEYFVMVNPKKIWLYRPPIYGWNQTIFSKNFIDKIYRASITHQNEKYYLLLIFNTTQDWNLKKYQLVKDSAQLLKEPQQKSFKKIVKGQTLSQDVMLNTYNYNCIISTYIVNHYGFFFYKSLYCFDFENKVQQILKFKSGYTFFQSYQQSNDIFYLFNKDVYKLSIQQQTGNLTDVLVYSSLNGENITIGKVYQKEIFLLMQNPNKTNYVLILQQYQELYFPTQYLLYNLLDYQVLVFGKKYGQFNVFTRNKATARYCLLFTEQSIQQNQTSFFISPLVLSILLLIFFLIHISLNFKVSKRLFLFQRKYIILLLELFVVIIIHLGIFALWSFTDKTANTLFSYNSLRSVALQSFELKIYQRLFIYTALVSALIEGYLQFKAKSDYIIPLSKYGLNMYHYFSYRHFIIFLKAIAYSVLSAWVFTQLSERGQPRLKLNPSLQQLFAISVSYYLCQFILHNIANLLVYFCRSYYVYIEKVMACLFITIYINGQFYLNAQITVQQLLSTSINPLSLFQSITEQIFKAEVRFADKEMSNFLLSVLLCQAILSLTILRICFIRYYSATSLEKIIHVLENKEDKIINQSVEGEIFPEAFANNQKSDILLSAYIPCKLSNNQGLQKISILKQIRFSGKRNQIITFLDTENISKRVLFQILVNDKKSDKKIERDVQGQIFYSQNVKVSIILDDQVVFFQDLTLMQRLNLIITLRNPSISDNQKIKDIQFILDQFNIPQQFRNMKSSHLSGGYKKKAALVCGFIGNPDVVIIDEPTLGLDIRFKGILHRKLRQLKQHKLIILGTSDHNEAELVSDKLYILQNSKTIDRFAFKSNRLITRINLNFQTIDDYLKTKKLIPQYLKKQSFILEEQYKQEKLHYKSKLDILKEDNLSQKGLQNLIQNINIEFDYNSNKILFSFAIIDHPYDQSSTTLFKEEQNRQIQLTWKDIELYNINKAFDKDSDDQLCNKQDKNTNKRDIKSRNLIRQLMDIQKNSSLYMSQIKGMLYLQRNIWKSYNVKIQIYIMCFYSFVQFLFWIRINRAIENYDFILYLVEFSILNFSIIDLKEREKQLVYLLGVSPSLKSFTTWLCDMGYLFGSFSLMLIIQYIILNGLILGNWQLNALEKLFCSFLYAICYTLVVSCLTKIRKDKIFVLCFLIITHFCLFQSNYNSFVISYQTKSFDFKHFLEYCFYPFTIMKIFDSISKNQPFWIQMLSFMLQVLLLFSFFMFYPKEYGKSKMEKKLKNYQHIHNQFINQERTNLQNIDQKTNTPIICDDLIHVYAKKATIKNLTMHINEGEIYGLLGHNGCGKTTALEIISGQIQQTRGKIYIFGQEKEKSWIGYCPQGGILQKYVTVEQNIRFVGALRGLSSKYVTFFMVKMLRYFRLKNIEQVKVKYLSEVQKKKVSLIVALLGFPRVVLLDEPTSSVDAQGRKKMITLLRSYCEELKASVLIASHEIGEAQEYCDRVSILKDGVLRRAGSPLKLILEKQHQFYLLTLSFPDNVEQALLEKSKARVKQYICELTFVMLERQERLIIVYSLDIKRINIFNVWKKIYTDFYLSRIVDKFCLRRHGLQQVVKCSIVNQSEDQMSKWQNNRGQNNSQLYERLI